MDIFISYRRGSGAFQAKYVDSCLRQMGVETFFDIDSVHNEDFLVKIKKAISITPNFLIILTKDYFNDTGKMEDYVFEEIDYALACNRNIILLAFDGYKSEDVDWNSLKENYRIFRTLNYFECKDISSASSSLLFNDIVENMINLDGSKFSLDKPNSENSWYKTHGLSDEDKKWIKADFIVCRDLDKEVISLAMKQESVFKNRNDLKLLSFKMYDIDDYKLKYDLNVKTVTGREIKISDVYGVTFEEYVDDANLSFGDGHFISDVFEAGDYIKKIKILMDKNKVDSFDIIDLTLVLKDLKNPEKILRELSYLLNEEGGVIYVRELDDDFVVGYPDSENYIKVLKKILLLDSGAGNRHLGKKLFTYLSKSGASNIYVSDRIISTANTKKKYREAFFQNYFSYLKPELKSLVESSEKNKNDQNHDKYVKAYEWIEEHFEEIENMFCSQEFYFRAGYIAGYGVFNTDD